MIAGLLRRLSAAGLGLAWLTQEKAEAFVQELVRQGEMSREEGRELLEELIRRAEMEKDELQRRIDAEVRRIIKSAGVASREDVRRLEERIEGLEARLERLEARIEGLEGQAGAEGAGEESPSAPEGEPSPGQ